MDNTPVTANATIVSNGLFNMLDAAPLLAPLPSAPLAPNGGVDNDDEDDVGIRDGRMLLLVMRGAMDGALDGT